ncbi:restriction endonuclease [Nostoc spongiaeforme FACHB-130]|uniref:Restriction endonuclease n=1 Tax=Nostoc spongiaeforme FACHB-130 TaxID=1357510 RepID=A0ABR8FN89_9NOSO|nr:restriction endonuclease [Nostoc spongiaeforme]MBD2592761.1 restriction endonuclease [Nostoc spongiaeforme FACHB-130]
MTTDAEYQARIITYAWDDLKILWSEIKTKNTSNFWDEGKALEYLVLRAFQLDGAEIAWPYTVKIQDTIVEQIDGVVYTDGLACLIECKDTAKEVNIEPIAKLRNQLLRRSATAIGSVFSRSGFTESAVTLTGFVAPQTILLWRGEEIEYSLTNQCICRFLVKKYRVCVQKCIPNYDIKTEIFI